MFVIGCRDTDDRAVNTIYRLSLETYQWTTLAPMRTARYGCADVLLDDYVYIFGGNIVIAMQQSQLIATRLLVIPGMIYLTWQ